MTRRFLAAFREMVDAVDRIHVYAGWAAELLEANGVPRSKLACFRTGVPARSDGRTRGSSPAATPLRIVFLGRCDPVKGLHVLVEAVRGLPPAVPLRISFYGPYWDSLYGRGLRGAIGDDPRFLSPEALPPRSVMDALWDADILVVPSLWLETGPLVVLEAFGAGVPVVGSRLGGIAELVADGVDGLLFPPGDAAALAGILRALAEDPARVDALRRGIRPPRTMRDVAEDTARLYGAIVASSAMA